MSWQDLAPIRERCEQALPVPVGTTGSAGIGVLGNSVRSNSPSTVHELLKEIMATLEKAEGFAGQLIDNLSPVLRPEEPKVTAQNPPRAQTALVQILDQVSGRLGCLTELLASINRRLAL